MSGLTARTIYQKTFSMGGLKAAGKTVVPHGINNHLTWLLAIRGIARNTVTTINHTPLTSKLIRQFTPIIAISISNTYADLSGYKTSFVTIQYVKRS